MNDAESGDAPDAMPPKVLHGIHMTDSDIEKVTEPLAGHRLLSVEKMDWTWFFRLTGEITLATESPWRLIQGRIVVTSEDHLQQFGLPEPVDAVDQAAERLSGRAIERATIAPSSGDLAIDFEGGATLQLLQMSCGYESWRLEVQGSTTVCTGGGELVRYPV